MSQDILAPLRSYNNDRMGMLTAFRSAAQTARQRAGETSAAVALPATPPPRPTQLDDAQAEAIMNSVQQEAGEMMQAHSNLDPQRVARLLGLLE